RCLLVSKHAYEFSKRVHCRRNLLIRTATLKMAKTLPFKVAPAYAPVSKHAYEFSKRVYCRRNLLIRTATLNGQTPAI
ncbi:MAG: hypothetical protein ABF912_12685, partial [Lacticaseibacillus paracasei]